MVKREGADMLKRIGISGAVVFLTAAIIFAGSSLRAMTVRNGSLREKGAAPTFTQKALDKLRADGWQCPDLSGWPTWWGGLGSNMKLEYFSTGGKDGDGYIRIAGSQGLVSVYHATALEGNQIFSFWARGKGTLRAGYIAWKVSDDRQKLEGQVALPPIIVKVEGNKWVRYRHVLIKPDYEVSLHPVFSTLEGSIDLDEVDIEPSDAGLDLIVEEEEKLYGTGGLIENLTMAQADDTFREKAGQFKAALKAFSARAGNFEKDLADSLQRHIDELKPYVLTEGITTVQVAHYNEMIALTRVLERLAGMSVAEIKAIKAKEAVIQSVKHQIPGVRLPRKNTVTITDVRSNKVRYDENENATTTVTVVNKGASAAGGTLIARMILELDTTREITRTAFSIAPGEKKKWSFSYSVGPETYARVIEVSFVDASGKAVDSWQEYYNVAAEFFRVAQHSFDAQNTGYPVTFYNTYITHGHFFASEPTDAGVYPIDAEQYLSGQAGYRVNQSARQAQIDFWWNYGITFTFYQTFAFCGQMGYEVMREHPEWVLYDDNGQFAVDPIYGGYPNPAELASPIEVGPKRKEMKIKPYLDRLYTPWPHSSANWADEEWLRYFANCIKEYAKAKRFKGIYVDGNVGIQKGYAYDGAPNVPSGKYEDIVRLNARNHRVFSEILKADNPNFGTWFNWSIPSMEWCFQMGLVMMCGSGSGVMGDTMDDNIRAATDWKNVMLLYETQCLRLAPKKLLDDLIIQRDHVIQRYGASAIVGYNFFKVPSEEPGPSKWSWPAANYMGSILIATQLRHAGGFRPSFRPTLQFQTRYSRFLWARDIKIVPDGEKIVHASGPEELWWKRLIYKRKTDDGYELIVHVLRIPPTDKFDQDWADEPKPLEGVKITADIAGARVRDVLACRPYHFEEEQQVVQKVLNAKVEGGKATVEIPPFRYHTMVVFRLYNR